MSNIVIIVLALYLLVGLALVTIGPFGQSLRQEVEHMRGKSFRAAIQADQGEPIPSLPMAKIVAFVIIMSVVCIALWPVLVVSEIKGKSVIGETLKGWDGDLTFTFSDIGGAGRIVCGDCGYSVKIVSFLHGAGNCTTGYQCQSCGRFVQVNDSLLDTVENGCQCGGTLSRQKKLFCPKCRTKNVRYLMEYIT